MPPGLIQLLRAIWENATIFSPRFSSLCPSCKQSETSNNRIERINVKLTLDTKISP